MTEPTQHERDIIATDEMIRNLKAGSFRKIATGSAAILAVLLVGTAAIVWATKQGNDPEALKEALRHMPTLTVKLENDTLKLADNTVKMDPDNNLVKLVNPPLLPQVSGKGSHDPAIQESVVVFKKVEYGQGFIETGWNFPNGAARTPDEQWCNYKQNIGPGNVAVQFVGRDGEISVPPAGVKDQTGRFARCQWFNGHLG